LENKTKQNQTKTCKTKTKIVLTNLFDLGPCGVLVVKCLCVWRALLIGDVDVVVVVVVVVAGQPCSSSHLLPELLALRRSWESLERQAILFKIMFLTSGFGGKNFTFL
jgi:hypothetical protein